MINSDGCFESDLVEVCQSDGGRYDVELTDVDGNESIVLTSTERELANEIAAGVHRIVATWVESSRKDLL
jgi:hypothetical protein